MTKLSVHLITFNGSKYIPFLFDSLRKQTYQDWELLAIDNSSTDNTVELIQKELLNFPVSSRLIVNKDNKGFAGGHNQAYHETKSEYFLILNQDIYLEKDCLGKLMQFTDSHPETAAITPRLMRWDFDKKEFTNQIDSLGLKVFRNRRVVEKGQGEEWTDNDGDQEIFGVSGACALFRRKVIDTVGAYCCTPSHNGCIFDESYFMYKEDVDLAFRLRSAGYSAYLVADAVAYHDRTAVGEAYINTPLHEDIAAAKNKKNQSFYIRYHAYKNHLMTLYKNEYWRNLLLDFPWIFWYELKKFGYFLLFDRAVLKGLKEIWRDRQELKGKRLKIKDLRKVSWKGMRKWW